MTSLILIPVFVYLGLAVIALFFSEKVIFQPQPASYRDDESIIKLPTSNGQRISVKFFENPSARYTILYSHGNAEDIGTVEPLLTVLRDSGFSVAVYDYRGYGTSEGVPSETNTYEDIDCVYRYLTEEKGVAPERLILHGRSLGGAVAIDLASRKRVAGLIIESSFTSAFSVPLSVRLLPFDKYASLDKLKNIACPILVIHGRQDRTIPFHHGEKLYAAAPGKKDFLWVDNAQHNDLLDKALFSYLRKIAEFSENL